ncbi:MAG: glycoside hydrolase family 3 [Alphaproteobacteria bacterium]|jgi:beta-N-acetylhexosaminidase|nr:glycoside hydrolase family 3 [Alphaproteobacteria bacterium]
MDIEYKIGQMILIGFKGYSLPEAIKNQIENGFVSGVNLHDYDRGENKFEQNIKSFEQLSLLINEIRSTVSEIPLFIGISQEGGMASRLKKDYGFEQIDSAKKIGNRNDVEYSYKEYFKMALELKKLGFNLNLAPVVDINTNLKNPVISLKDRSFSSSSNKVSKHSEQFIKAHNDLNILTSVKHFPGHGSSNVDSHLGFVDITESWSEDELIPYEYLINNNRIDMIMTSHVFNKNLDDKYPATLSKNILKGMLRNRLAFDGVIISDNIEMKALSENYSFEEIVLRGIEAGIDIFTITNSYYYDENIAIKFRNLILKKLKEGVISEERIDESYKRIMKLKKKYGIIS